MKEVVEPEPKSFTRTNSGRIILYFTATQVVKTAKKQECGSMNLSKAQRRSSELISKTAELDEPRDKAPKIGRWVHVYERSNREKNRGLVLTTLNLNKLGWANSCRRLFGRCNDIYVVDCDEDSLPPAALVA